MLAQAAVVYEGTPSAESFDRCLEETWRKQNMYSLSRERVLAFGRGLEKLTEALRKTEITFFSVKANILDLFRKVSVYSWLEAERLTSI